jgi:Tfp pilus assembly protein PilV
MSKCRRGLSLVEVLFGLVILGLAIVPLLTLNRATRAELDHATGMVALLVRTQQRDDARAAAARQPDVWPGIHHIYRERDHRRELVVHEDAVDGLGSFAPPVQRPDVEAAR